MFLSWLKCNYNIDVTNLRFEWDEAKNLSNQNKHGICFELASQVFLDPFCFSVQDRIENGEARWQTFGQVAGCLVLLVAHTVSERNEHGDWIEVVRLISARRTTRKERQRYEDENR
jgi:uncharacterized DUF497 family protein